MIKIIAIGKIKEKYLVDLINDYKTRIGKYHKIEIVEIPDNDIEQETNNILKYIKSNEYVISLAIEGKEYDSVELSKLIDKTFINYPTITFIIGESNGLSNEIKDKSNLLLSFSKLTFPHGLFRGILLEQIYRSFKILNNESYHK